MSIHGTAPWKDVPQAVQAFLELRGFSSLEEAQDFLNFSLKDIADPSSLLGMDVAVQRILQAFARQESICIYGDFDMDGTPAVALLIRGFKALGFKNVFPLQADRHKDGYGFHFHLAQAMMGKHKVSLFITADVGITDVDAVRQVQELGVDVIVTDHHQEKEQLPPAIAVINPNQKLCTSKLQHLCGTGVAFYLMMALNRSFREQKLISQPIDIKSLLDCFAIATIADLVPLVKENRILVKHGLKVLEATSMLGIRALMTALQLNNKALSPQDVGIRLVPKLNSLTRMGGDVMPIDLFLVENPEEAIALAAKALEVNDVRVKSLKKAEKELSERFESEAEFPFFWSYSSSFHKGLVGLLASRAVNITQKSAFVGSLLSDQKTIVGSARTPDKGGHNVFAALTHCESVLNKFGGHPQAAGFEISIENVDAFKNRLKDYFLKTPLSRDTEDAKAYDLSLTLKEAKDFLAWLVRLEPFGVGFSSPVLCFKNCLVSEVKTLKGGEHFKLSLRDATRETLSAVVFSYKGPPLIEQGIYTITGDIQWNEFRGNRTPQFMIESIVPCEDLGDQRETPRTL